jgi:hypothetical protein
MMVYFGFDLEVPAERREAERLWELRASRTEGIDERKVREICSKRAGQLVIVGAARHFAANQVFTRQSLAAAIGHTEGQVSAWVRQLGRPEKRLGVRIFEKHNQPDGTTAYSLSPTMHAAVLRVA